MYVYIYVCMYICIHMRVYMYVYVELYRYIGTLCLNCFNFYKYYM